MTIHHSIIKKAAGLGVILTQDDDGIKANLAEHGILITLEVEDEAEASAINEQAQDALRDVLEMRDYQAEHPKIAIRHEDGDFVAYHRAGRGLGDEIARDPELADLFETLQEQDPDGGEADDEDEQTGSVVPAKYKREYAERGDPANCGDWLALELKGLCRVLEDGKEVTDLDRLQTIANANDVDPARYGKLGVATNGWQGRYRMTIRNMLTPRVAAKGFLFIPEGVDAKGEREIKAPRQWCIEHSPKPKAPKTASPKAAVAKNEGAGKASAKTQAKKGPKLDGIAAAGEAIRSSKAKEAARRAAK
jgi:hypothetical protein